MRVWISLALATFLFAVPAPAADVPAAGKPRVLENLLQEFATLPLLGKRDLDQILRFRIDGDQLFVEPLIDPINQWSRVEIPQFPGITRIECRAARRLVGGQPSLYLQLHNRNPNPSDGMLAELTLFTQPGGLNLRRMVQRSNESYIVQYMQSGLANSPDRVRLTVQRIQVPGGQLLLNQMFSAPSLGELRRRHPRETVDFLRPLFAAMGKDQVVFSVDPRAAWQVLADAWKPDPALINQVKALLLRLNDDDYPTRQAASEELAKLGQPAALALTRIDRTTLSPEQLARIDSFLGPFHPLPPKQIARLREDPDFLCDCLATDDTVLAAAALARLQTVIGQPISFDLTRPPDQRFAALPALRRSLASPPATAPAKP